MADRPIIFSAPMILALLDGRKTQTQRLAERFVPAKRPPSPHLLDKVGHLKPTHWTKIKPGDRLWVRETWATWMHAPVLPKGLGGELSRDPEDWLYKATDTDWNDMDHDRRFLAEGNAKREDGRSGNYIIRSPIHMPRWASRLTLVVTAAKIERVQEISGSDVEAEGAPNSVDDPLWFVRLWDSVHGKGAWDSNPEVVALTFAVYHRNIDARGKPDG